MSKNCLNPVFNKMRYSGSIIENTTISKINHSNYNLHFVIYYYFYILLFKIINCNFSPQLKSVLVFSQHHYSSRRNNIFFIPRLKNNTCQRSFSYVAASMWNKLPLPVSKITNLSNFKISLREFLLNNC